MGLVFKGIESDSSQSVCMRIHQGLAPGVTTLRALWLLQLRSRASGPCVFMLVFPAGSGELGLLLSTSISR